MNNFSVNQGKLYYGKPHDRYKNRDFWTDPAGLIYELESALINFRGQVSDELYPHLEVLNSRMSQILKSDLSPEYFPGFLGEWVSHHFQQDIIISSRTGRERFHYVRVGYQQGNLHKTLCGHWGIPTKLTNEILETIKLCERCEKSLRSSFSNAG